MLILLQKTVAFILGIWLKGDEELKKKMRMKDDKYITKHFDFRLRWKYKWSMKMQGKMILLMLIFVMS
jgi:hypothetical protein